MNRALAKKPPIRKRTASVLPSGYGPFFKTIKDRIWATQVRAALAANSELIHLYWDIGHAIAERQQQDGWGAAVIPRLAQDIQNELPEVKGFSERNIGYMIRFAREYGPDPILQQAAAKLPVIARGLQPVTKMVEGDPLPILQRLVAELPWGHNVILVEKVKDLPTRLWYMQQTIEQGWSRNVLALMIDGQAHRRARKAVHNFQRTPSPQSGLSGRELPLRETRSPLKRTLSARFTGLDSCSEAIYRLAMGQEFVEARLVELTARQAAGPLTPA